MPPAQGEDAASPWSWKKAQRKGGEAGVAGGYAECRGRGVALAGVRRSAAGKVEQDFGSRKLGQGVRWRLAEDKAGGQSSSP